MLVEKGEFTLRNDFDSALKKGDVAYVEEGAFVPTDLWQEISKRLMKLEFGHQGVNELLRKQYNTHMLYTDIRMKQAQAACQEKIVTITVDGSGNWKTWEVMALGGGALGVGAVLGYLVGKFLG